MTYDVIIIGAGPAGSVAAALLAKRGYRVRVLERDRFPRFSIGESLLPQMMVWLEQAGVADRIAAAGFQRKNGATFRFGERESIIDFRQKSAVGPSETWQVRRDRFDQILADCAADSGAEVSYRTEVIDFTPGTHPVSLTVRTDGGDAVRLQARHVFDASGFGRVLARLLSLDRPSDLPPRRALFSHMRDHITDAGYDRDKIMISVDPVDRDIWYWLIPFADGVSSVGAVGPVAAVDGVADTDAARFSALVARSGHMGHLLRQAELVRPVGAMSGYAAKVSSLVGPGYTLLGNAAEFLDPIFSSGITIALKSAALAVDVLDRQLHGEEVDWQKDYAVPLQRGIDTFRCYVEAWYDHSLQDIIFRRISGANQVKQMITSVLAGYAWDADNRLAADPKRYLPLLLAASSN